MCVFVRGKNEVQYDKNCFGRHWTHNDEPLLNVVLTETKLKDLEMDLKIPPTPSSFPSSNHHPSLA